MKLIIDIDEQHFELLQMAVMNGMGDKVEKMIAQGIPIPDNATNGEVIDLIFPYEKTIDEVWWNAPYQKGDKE